MSTSPAAAAAAAASAAPATHAANGTAPPRARRRPKTNPLVQPNRRPAPGARRPPPPPDGRPAVAATNGSQPLRTRPLPTPSAPAKVPTIPSEDIAPENATIFPLVTTKKELLHALRYHVLRFHSKRSVDPSDEATFTRPVRLHRRDPAAPPTGVATVQPEEPEETEKDHEKQLEREKLEAAKEERRRVREEMQKQIAPSLKKPGEKGSGTGGSSNNASSSKRNPFHKKTEQVYRPDDTPEARKRSQLRYEEAMPWHLEDFDNKNIFVGSYEAALSETHVALCVDGEAFRLLPLEKWYKFTPKNKFDYLTSEQAEEMMTRKVKESRWVMDRRQKEAKDTKEQALLAKPRLFTRSGQEEKITSRKVKKEDGDGVPAFGGEEQGDADMLDFNLNEEFQDDDHDPLFEGEDAEIKEAEERIERERLEANIFDQNDEADVDREEEIEKLQKSLRKAQEKGTRKALLKREKNFDYEDDSDKDPYASSSATEESDEEARLAAENKKREEERKQLQQTKEAGGSSSQQNDGKPSSGTSTKGSNTPAGKSSSSQHRLKKGNSASSLLKRSGSPNLSEASGNESSRKKLKTTNTKKNTNTSPTSASLASQNRLISGGASPLSGRHGSGSDSEATDGGSMKKGGSSKIKLKLKQSPTQSRAGSPGVGGATSVKGGASRAGSPGVGASISRKGSQTPTTAPTTLPTAEEIVTAIPATGIEISQLIGKFKSRVAKDQQKEFVQFVKRNVRYDGATKRMYPL